MDWNAEAESIQRDLVVACDILACVDQQQLDAASRSRLEFVLAAKAFSAADMTPAAALVVADTTSSLIKWARQEHKPQLGQIAKRWKDAAKTRIDEERNCAERSRLDDERQGKGFDATLPPAAVERGSLHPITQVTRELEDLFTSMWWTILDGPEIETEELNFDALNIAADHPARETMDTFWIAPLPNVPPNSTRLVMRTHTSPVQVRAMRRLKPPFRAIVPGKVFRNEAVDASHEHTFHQMEGLVVGKDISVGHLIGAMKTLLRGIFGRDIEIRLRPGYFPFVEPGFELDARCPFCSDGCSVCKRSTWIELLPCGMVHPNVLRSGGIDPEQWTGFAFGLGLSRLVMLRYKIDDIRHLLGGDVRFLEQF